MVSHFPSPSTSSSPSVLLPERMRSPEFLNGEVIQASPRGRGPVGGGPAGFRSTVSQQKLRRFNTLVLIFRVATFCFLLASTIFMGMNSHGSSGSRWFHYDAFRYLVAANAIIGIYSFFEMASALWERLNGSTILPGTLQLWFDFTHDQAFAYLLLSANSSATALTWNLRRGELCPGLDAPCQTTDVFCAQSYISVALGFFGFVFLAASSVMSGFRVACFVITGSLFYV